MFYTLERLPMGRKKELFGEVAIKLGYVTKEQVKEALNYQKDMKTKENKHKLLGMIMLELGMLGTTELINILRYLESKPNVSIRKDIISPP
jgi:hypothetical protein